MVTTEPKTLDQFFTTTLSDVERTISETIKDDEIKKILHGGKRLRSLLAHLSFKACTAGKDKPDQCRKALEGTVSIELAHTASLVHDDIIDNDSERRGKTAFHVKSGIGKAILVGHKMLTTGFQIALSHGNEVAKLYVDSWDEVVNGEIDEVDFNKRGFKNELNIKSQIFEAYNKIIDLKTAVLFSSACQAGALEADMRGEILKVFRDYGREIGLAYQLADDLVDLAHGEMIDSVIIPLLNRLESKPIKKGSLKAREIRKLFARNEDKIREFYMEEIKKHVAKAKNLSKSNLIPKSNYKNMMQQAPDYIINRMLDDINISI